MDLTKSPAVSGLLAEYDENLARADQLGGDVVANSHVSLLGLLCGDVTPTVVWKIMYLSHSHPHIDERCTMLSVVTEYIVNSPALLENKNATHRPHSSSPMIRVLPECWQHALLPAKTQLDAKSFVSFNLTLARCILTLRPYNLHHDFRDAMKLSAGLRGPSYEVCTLNKTQQPCFPQHALIPLRKRLNITRAKKPTTYVDLLTSAGQSFSIPARQTFAHVKPSGANPRTDNTPARLTSTLTPVHQTATAPDHQKRDTPIHPIPTNGVSVNNTSSCSQYFQECLPSSTWLSVRSLIYSELEQFHFVRSSPAIQLHTTTTSRATPITKPVRASGLDTTAASSHLSTVRTHVADLRLSVHTENTRSSLHTKDRTVTKELYFNPE